MKNKTQLRVNVSINDFPFFVSLDSLFAGLKAAGADGLEVIPGIKSRWRFDYLAALSTKYRLPIYLCISLSGHLLILTLMKPLYLTPKRLV